MGQHSSLELPLLLACTCSWTTHGKWREEGRGGKEKAQGHTHRHPLATPAIVVGHNKLSHSQTLAAAGLHCRRQQKQGCTATSASASVITPSRRPRAFPPMHQGQGRKCHCHHSHHPHHHPHHLHYWPQQQQQGHAHHPCGNRLLQGSSAQQH